MTNLDIGAEHTSYHLNEEGFPWLGTEPVTMAALKLSPLYPSG